MFSNSIFQRSLWARGIKYARRNDSAPEIPRVGSKRTRMAARPIVFFIFFLLRPIISKIYAKMDLAWAAGPAGARLCPKGVSCHLIWGIPRGLCLYPRRKPLSRKARGGAPPKRQLDPTMQKKSYTLT